MMIRRNSGGGRGDRVTSRQSPRSREHWRRFLFWSTPRGGGSMKILTCLTCLPMPKHEKDRGTCSSGLSARWTARSCEWRMDPRGRWRRRRRGLDRIYPLFGLSRSAGRRSMQQQAAWSISPTGWAVAHMLPPSGAAAGPFSVANYFFWARRQRRRPFVFRLRGGGRGGGRPGGSASQAVSLPISPLRIGGIWDEVCLSSVVCRLSFVPRPTHRLGQGRRET